MSYKSKYADGAAVEKALDAGLAADIASLAAHDTPIDADAVLILDSTTATQKKTLWSAIKSTLKTYFDTLYSPTTHAHGRITSSGYFNGTFPASGIVLYDNTNKIYPGSKVPVENGGTNAVNATDALTNLGAQPSIGTANGILKGNGSGAISAATAGTDYQAPIAGGATTITSSNLTASRALASDTNGKVAVSSVTAAELGYVSGVTSGIQSQLGGKQATITGGATTIASSDLTASRALASSASGKVAVSAVTATELGYVAGVTSGIQTQLGGKQASISVSGILKGDGSGGVSAATAGTDYYAPSGTDVAVADGGTGASTAATALSNLGITYSTTDLTAGSSALTTGAFYFVYE